ncbi:hypothetical protein [Pengzhenrongella frigida]|uniref:Glycosyltransferase RgtA/B/C/D-like domain-containing protein n=1 Tax=Pengzhenrongella frigida TaxID=1259133 RepID=A0A4Q5N022_9MICO|nr:hypothetical protein [Cellulomonas sp. HLT2-17]RYV49827.1 hypothetical protein EUA98_16640 [Cellulomonas sp. HLT2-17]
MVGADISDSTLVQKTPAPPSAFGLPLEGGRQATVRAVLCTLGVLLAHFRPWQGGLVEELGILLAWQGQGFSAYTAPASIQGTLGRPLHLLPAYVSLEISQGGYAGLYGALALAALAQLLLVVWGLRPTGASSQVRWFVALALALHPWWIGGFTLRFLPAQVAIALCALWLGATVRFGAGGGRRWLVVAYFSLLAALLHYQAPAFGVLLGTAALIVVLRWPVRRAAGVAAVALAAVATSGAWALVFAPRIAATYEAAIIDAYDIAPSAAVTTAYKTVLLHSPSLLLLLVGVGLVVLSLGFSQVLTPGRAWLLLVMIAGTPGAALIFYPSSFHLASAEHVQLAVGLGGWLVLAALAVSITQRPRLALVVAATLAAAGLAGGVFGYAHWGRLALEQHSLVEAAVDMRDSLKSDQVLIAADRTGYYGSLYLFPPPHLDIAVQLHDGPGPEVILCTPADIVRQPGLATPDCAAVMDRATASFLGTEEMERGPVDFYAVQRAS